MREQHSAQLVNQTLRYLEPLRILVCAMLGFTRIHRQLRVQLVIPHVKRVALRVHQSVQHAKQTQDCLVHPRIPVYATLGTTRIQLLQHAQHVIQPVQRVVQ